MFWDIAIVETLNGGDLRIVGNDLAVVNGLENMPYLGMFGGNLEADTKPKVVELQSKDWWGNNLLMRNNSSIQMNSSTERTMNTVALTSFGRQLIENAIKTDLKFLAELADVDVAVVAISDDRIQINLKVKQSDGTIKIIVINGKKSTDADFYILDFNDDFNV